MIIIEEIVFLFSFYDTHEPKTDYSVIHGIIDIMSKSSKFYCLLQLETL